MKGRCNRCGMDIDCKPYEDTWLCRDCMQEVEEEVALNNSKSAGADITSSPLSGPFFVFPSASVTTRARYFIADMDFQKKHAADCLIKLKALRAEEEHARIKNQFGGKKNTK